MYNDDDLFTEDRERATQTKAINAVKIMVGILLVSSAYLGAVTLDMPKYFASVGNTVSESIETINVISPSTRIYNRNTLDRNRVPSTKVNANSCISWSKPHDQNYSNYSQKIRNDVCKKSKQVDRSVVSSRSHSKKINTETCIYWNKKYNQNHSNYNQLMRNDACKRAGYKIEVESVSNRPKTRLPLKQRTRIHENKRCTSLSICRRYKVELEGIQNTMRQGYKASQYNYLEGKKRRLRSYIYDNCKCHSPSSY